MPYDEEFGRVGAWRGFEVEQVYHHEYGGYVFQPRLPTWAEPSTTFEGARDTIDRYLAIKAQGKHYHRPKPGTRYRVKDTVRSLSAEPGEVLTLMRDNGVDIPCFERSNGFPAFFHYRFLEELDDGEE